MYKNETNKDIILEISLVFYIFFITGIAFHIINIDKFQNHTIFSIMAMFTAIVIYFTGTIFSFKLKFYDLFILIATGLIIHSIEKYFGFKIREMIGDGWELTFLLVISAVILVTLFDYVQCEDKAIKDRMNKGIIYVAFL